MHGFDGIRFHLDSARRRTRRRTRARARGLDRRPRGASTRRPRRSSDGIERNDRKKRRHFARESIASIASIETIDSCARRANRLGKRVESRRARWTARDRRRERSGSGVWTTRWTRTSGPRRRDADAREARRGETVVMDWMWVERARTSGRRRC